MSRTVVILVYPGIAPLDVAGPMQAFMACGDSYSLTVASLEGGLVETDCPGFSVASVQIAAIRTAIDTLVIPGGEGVFNAIKSVELLDVTKRLAARARRVASVCIGAFVLAEAGLLAGKRATTHWRATAQLKRSYPRTLVDEDAIFVKDGAVWSSAGVSAGIDLALALIEEDHGRNIALGVARELVVFLKRPGGQSQFSHSLNSQINDRGGRFETLIAWIQDNLDADLSTEVLASRSAMSLRSFVRRFPEATGVTPAQYVQKLRLEAALRLMERADLSLAEIAKLCGFSEVQKLRRAMQRSMKISPAEFRERFTRSFGQTLSSI